MDMDRENTLEVMVKTESTMCGNWLAFEPSSLFLQLLKAIT